MPNIINHINYMINIEHRLIKELLKDASIGKGLIEAEIRAECLKELLETIKNSRCIECKNNFKFY